MHIPSDHTFGPMFQRRPEPPPVGAIKQIGHCFVEHRRCLCGMAPCICLIRFFVRSPGGDLVAAGFVWDILCHYRGWYPLASELALRPKSWRGGLPREFESTTFDAAHADRMAALKAPRAKLKPVAKAEAAPTKKGNRAKTTTGAKKVITAAATPAENVGPSRPPPPAPIGDAEQVSAVHVNPSHRARSNR